MVASLLQIFAVILVNISAQVRIYRGRFSAVLHIVYPAHANDCFDADSTYAGIDAFEWKAPQFSLCCVIQGMEDHVLESEERMKKGERRWPDFVCEHRFDLCSEQGNSDVGGNVATILCVRPCGDINGGEVDSAHK